MWQSYSVFINSGQNFIIFKKLFKREFAFPNSETALKNKVSLVDQVYLFISLKNLSEYNREGKADERSYPPPLPLNKEHMAIHAIFFLNLF